MNRCTRSRIGAALAACALAAGPLLVTPLPAIAQGIVREAPKDVKPGRMVITAAAGHHHGRQGRPPLAGRAHPRPQNMLLMSGSIVGQDLPVVYRRDPSGLVHEVWMLTPDEYRRLGGVDMSTPRASSASSNCST